MPLKTQKLSIDFGLGVDEFTDRKLVKEGKLIRAENITFNGNKKIQKRAGFRPQGMHDLDGVPIESPDNLFKYEGKPLIMSKNNIYSDAESDSLSDAVNWRQTGVFNFQTKPELFDVGRFSGSKSALSDTDRITLDQKTLKSGVRCCVWGSREQEEVGDFSSGSSIGVSVYDTNNNNVLLDTRISEDGRDAWTCVKVIEFGSQGGTPRQIHYLR